MAVNRVVLTGRLTRDPELRTTTTGKEVCNMRIAVDRNYKAHGQPETDFFGIVAWGHSARFAGDYLTKGRLIAVDGRLQVRQYTTQDGQTREVTEVVADSLLGLDRARDDGNSGGGASGGNGDQGRRPVDDEYDPFADE